MNSKRSLRTACLALPLLLVACADEGRERSRDAQPPPPDTIKLDAGDAPPLQPSGDQHGLPNAAGGQRPDVGTFERPDGGYYHRPDGGYYHPPDGGYYQRPDGGYYQRPDGGYYQRPDGGYYQRPERDDL